MQGKVAYEHRNMRGIVSWDPLTLTKALLVCLVLAYLVPSLYKRSDHPLNFGWELAAEDTAMCQISFKSGGMWTVPL